MHKTKDDSVGRRREGVTSQKVGKSPKPRDKISTDVLFSVAYFHLDKHLRV